MKKIVRFGLLPLCLFFGLILAACGSTATNTAVPVATTIAPRPTTAAPVATATGATTSAPTTAVVATSSPTVAAKPSPTAVPANRQTRIIEPTTGFPRKVQSVNGIVEIKAKPMRIHTVSLGYDEITVRLVDLSRIAAISQVSTDVRYSNIAEIASQIPLKVGRGAEQILAAKPDLVVASPFTNKDLLKQLSDAGVTLVNMGDLDSSLDGLDETIRFLAYIYGEEQKGEDLIKEVADRQAKVDVLIAKQGSKPKPRVLNLQANAYVSGKGSSGDAIIRRAGAVNVAAEAGIESTKQISLESIIKMNPDYIVLDGTADTNGEAFKQVTDNPALLDVPAVKNKKIFGIKGTYLSTLSQWNMNGVEELAKILYPAT